MDPALALEVTAVSRHRELIEGIEKEGTVQLHYAGATAFITGGSGFLGKQLIEKLIRSTDIKKVYLLMRPKKQKSIEERIEEMLKESVFDELRRKKPGFHTKLAPVAGDVSKIRLGISDGDWNTLCEEVEVIMHVAATIGFDEPIKLATLTNVRGTREVITLGKNCRRLRSFVHVSTAYSHATKSRINKDVVEKFYETPVPPEVLIGMVETMKEDRLDDITTGLIHDWPNTYSFTKAVAEDLVRTSGDLPICIVRPAIVIGSRDEPRPGWVDKSCVNGASGIITGIGMGVIHVSLARDIKIDLVPVDLVNNAILAAGWATASLSNEGGRDKKIYTISCTRNSVRHRRFTELMIQCESKFPSPKAIWYCFVKFLDNKLLHFILSWLLHYIPAYIVDAICWTLGKPQRFVKLYRKIDQLTNLISYFTYHQWNLNDDNLLKMFKTMSPTDQIIYNCDKASINWDDYVSKLVIGIRRYLIKDDLKDTDYAVKKQFWLKLLHYSVMFLYFYIFCKMFSLFFSILSNFL